jgi:outer membrane protein insertion porin family
MRFLLSFIFVLMLFTASLAQEANSVDAATPPADATTMSEPIPAPESLPAEPTEAETPSYIDAPQPAELPEPPPPADEPTPVAEPTPEPVAEPEVAQEPNATTQANAANGIIIDRVDISGNKRVPNDRIRPYLVQAGSVFDPDLISRSIAQLYETNYFFEITVDASVADNEFVVTYVVQETPLIADIRIDGQKEITVEKILSSITLKVGDPLNLTNVGTSIKVIQTLYEAAQLYNATVEYSVEQINATSVNVVFTIVEGEPSRVYNIWFYGNEQVSSEELKTVMRTKEKDFWSVMNDSGSLIRDMLEYDRELIRQYYFSLGYAAAEIGEPEVVQQEDPSRLNYSIRINEGARYKVSDLEFVDSLGLFTSQDLAEIAKLKVGDYFNVTQYRQDIQLLTAKYTELGYAHANVDPITQIDHNAHTVSVTYNIQQGEMYTINRIVFKGNETTRDNVMRREFDIMEGDIYNSRLINEARRNMMVTSFFGDVRISERPAGPGEIDLIVEVEENKNGSINFTMAYSNTDGMLGRIEFAQANLFGYGSTLKALAEMQVEGERNNYQLSYIEPWILDHPYSTSIDLYSRQREYTERTEAVSGGAISLGHQPIKRRLFMNYTYANETVEIYDIAENASQYLLSEAGKTTIISFTPSITYSTVNSNLDPSEGAKASVSVKYAGTFLGGDVDYVKAVAVASSYHPMSYSFTGVLNARIGHMWSMNDSRLPISDRFYLGGMNTVRGFDLREISPKDEDGYSYGGDKFYQFNAEMWRPILDGNIEVRGVFFFDMGQVYDMNEEFGSTAPRM